MKNATIAFLHIFISFINIFLVLVVRSVPSVREHNSQVFFYMSKPRDTLSDALISSFPIFSKRGPKYLIVGTH